MKLKKEIQLLSKLSIILLITGIIVLTYSWYGIFLELMAIVLQIYLTRYFRISLLKIFFSLFFLLIIFIVIFYNLHDNKIEMLTPEWNLKQSASKYYFDPLFHQRSINFNFEPRMLDSTNLDKIKLFTTDTNAIPQEAPLK